jgi:hypothetical protein
MAFDPGYITRSRKGVPYPRACGVPTTPNRKSARASNKIGLVNLVYSLKRLIFLQGCFRSVIDGPCAYAHVTPSVLVTQRPAVLQVEIWRVVNFRIEFVYWTGSSTACSQHRPVGKGQRRGINND